ncbi:MAG: hypothetical protein ACYTFM_01905 [Planctomycetota bacterium]|jgi:small-conductance mechanosensitive channel
MKTVKVITLCLVVFLCLTFLVYGCKKKSEPAPPTDESTATTESIKDVVTEQTEQVKEVVETLKADVTTSINEIKAEVEKLNVDQLRQTALEYQKLIQAKTQEIENLTAKVKDMSVTEMLGDESTALTAEVDELNKAVTALKERFMLYYNKLKEKGGDLSGLTI